MSRKARDSVNTSWIGGNRFFGFPILLTPQVCMSPQKLTMSPQTRAIPSPSRSPWWKVVKHCEVADLEEDAAKSLHHPCWERGPKLIRFYTLPMSERGSSWIHNRIYVEGRAWHIEKQLSQSPSQRTHKIACVAEAQYVAVEANLHVQRSPDSESLRRPSCHQRQQRDHEV